MLIIKFINCLISASVLIFFVGLSPLNAQPSPAQDVSPIRQEVVQNQQGVGPGAEVTDIALSEDDIYQASLRALTVLLVLAIVIENALALIFNWNVYRAYFSKSGLQPVVSFAVSFVVVQQFHLDIVASLLDAYGEMDANDPSTLATEALTAMIVAGGSAGVNSLMRAFGYRSEPEADVKLPPKDKAWVAVRVYSKNKRSALLVSVTEAPSAGAEVPAIAGTVLGAKPNLFSLFTRNSNRFPLNGGYEVVPDRAYQISIVGQDEEGARKVVHVGGGQMKFAPRAIVDLEVTF